MGLQSIYTELVRRGIGQRRPQRLAALARRKRNNCHTSTPVDEPLVLLTRDREAQVALSWGLGGWKAAWAADHAMTLPRLSSVRLVQARRNPTLTNF